MKKGKEPTTANNTDVIEVETEEIELPLEKQIEGALVKANVTDAVISELADRYTGMKLKGLDDKETYLTIKEARKNVRAVGIMVEKVCKKGREDAIRIQKEWLETEKKHLAKINAIQNPLDDEIKLFEDEEERKEAEEKERKEAEYQQRQAILIKYGAQYANHENKGYFDLNHVSYEIDNIRDCDKEVWEELILPKYRTEFEKAEAEKVRIEKEREDAALKLKQEQEEFKKKQEELRKQQEELANQQRELQKMKDDAEREKRLAEEKRQQEINAANEKKWRDRLNEMKEVGWNGQFAFSKLGDDSIPVFTYEELIQLPDNDFRNRLNEYNDSIIKELEIREEKRIADAEVQRQKDIEDALQKERDRVAKEKADAEQKEIEEKIRKEDELARGKDREKFMDILDQFRAIKIHPMVSPMYKNKVQIIKEKLEEVLAL